MKIKMLCALFVPEVLNIKGSAGYSNKTHTELSSWHLLANDNCPDLFSPMGPSPPSSKFTSIFLNQCWLF